MGKKVTITTLPNGSIKTETVTTTTSGQVDDNVEIMSVKVVYRHGKRQVHRDIRHWDTVTNMPHQAHAVKMKKVDLTLPAFFIFVIAVAILLRMRLSHHQPL